jgi:hypothetical protein
MSYTLRKLSEAHGNIAGVAGRLATLVTVQRGLRAVELRAMAQRLRQGAAKLDELADEFDR